VRLHLVIPPPGLRYYAFYPEMLGRYDRLPSHGEHRGAGSFGGYNLHIVCAGKGRVKIGADWLELKPGAGFLYPPLCEQRYRTDPDDPWDVRWVHFSAGPETEWIRSLAGKDGWAFALGQLDEIVRLTDGLYRASEPFSSKNEVRISALLYELLLHLSAEAGSLRDTGSSARRDAIRRSADEIRERCAEDWTLARMAELAGYSAYYYNRLFHETMGRTPVHYLNEVRMAEAKRLLVATRMSVKEIAFAAGFKQTGYFVTLFRKMHGMTPTKYRNSFGCAIIGEQWIR